jgi:hypothetical protein
MGRFGRTGEVYGSGNREAEVIEVRGDGHEATLRCLDDGEVFSSTWALMCLHGPWRKVR